MRKLKRLNLNKQTILPLNDSREIKGGSTLICITIIILTNSHNGCVPPTTVSKDCPTVPQPPEVF